MVQEILILFSLQLTTLSLLKLKSRSFDGIPPLKVSFVETVVREYIQL